MTMTVPQSIYELRVAAARKGSHWFDPDTMEFFATKFHGPTSVDEANERLLFITSEVHPSVGDATDKEPVTPEEAIEVLNDLMHAGHRLFSHPVRLFTIRAGYASGSISTISRFGQFDTEEDAASAMGLLLTGAMSDEELRGL